MEAKDQHDIKTWEWLVMVCGCTPCSLSRGEEGVCAQPLFFMSGLRARQCKNSQAVGLISTKSSVQPQSIAGHWNDKLTLMTVSRYPSVLSIGVSASKVFLLTNLSFRTACSCSASFPASCCSLSFSSSITCCRSSFSLHSHNNNNNNVDNSNSNNINKSKSSTMLPAQ